MNPTIANLAIPLLVVGCVSAETPALRLAVWDDVFEVRHQDQQCGAQAAEIA